MSSQVIQGTIIASLVTLFIAVLMYSNIERFEDFVAETSLGVSDKYTTTHPSVPKKAPFNRQLTERERAESLYSPIITRPKDMTGRSKGGCNDELYPSVGHHTEMATPCNPEVSARYYGMRPILNPMNYYEMLSSIIKGIREPLPDKFEPHHFKYPREFDDSTDEVMQYVMERIYTRMSQMKEVRDFSRLDTSGGDKFAYWNVKIFAFGIEDQNRMSERSDGGLRTYGEQDRARSSKTYDEPKRFIVSFTLQNTSRSASTDLVALVFKIGGKLYLSKISFATRNNPKQKYEFMSVDSMEEDAVRLADTPQWIFQNTLENQTFNSVGRHSEKASENLIIPGGISHAMSKLVDEYDKAFLLPCGSSDGPNMRGGHSKSVFPNYEPDSDLRTQQQWAVLH